jgi:aryl carrier-like protein
MTYSQWENTVRSKVATSWVLHELLPNNLEFFILLSSLAGVFGNVSQSNYAAGNTFQDTLARYRTSQGMKALSINLGWMRTIGIIAEREEYQNFRMAGADMAKIEEDELMALLDIYCDPCETILDPARSQILIGTITPADLHSRGIKTPDVMNRPLFSSFSVSTAVAQLPEDTEGVDFYSLFRQSKTEEERVEVVITALATKLARSLSMSPDDIDHGKPLFEYGVDSLVAVELRNWIGKGFAADVPVFEIMGGATIAAISGLVSKKSTAKI